MSERFGSAFLGNNEKLMKFSSNSGPGEIF